MSEVQTTNWRVELLSNGLRLTALFGAVLYPPSLYLSFERGLYWLAASYTIAWSFVVVLHFWKGLEYRVRSVGFGATFYGLAVVLLMNSSVIGQVYLLGYSILMALFLGRHVGLATASLNMVTLMAVGWVYHHDGTVMVSGFEGAPLTWSLLSLQVTLVNAVIAVAVGEVVRVLEHSLSAEREARQQAMSEREAALAVTAELSKTVDALKESEARFKEFSENVREIFYVQDAITGDMLYWNAMYSELWGEPLESLKLAPQSYRDRVLPEDIPVLDDARRRRSEGETVEIEFRIRLSNGEIRWIQNRAYPVFADGVATRVVGTARDVTEQKRLQEHFYRTQRMESVGTLASGIAHDLNNVLSPILVSIDFLRSEIEDEDLQSMLGILEKSAQRGADLVRQILTITRGVEGQRKVLDLARVLGEVRGIVQETFPRNISLQWNVEPNTSTVLGDETHLQQVMMNLLLNARDALDEGGQLRVSLFNRVLDETGHHPPGKYLVLQVDDTGRGIPEAHLNRIFEPFFTTKELEKGTGLGLSTVVSIVERHGGFIEVDSALGEGTQFRVFLPAQIEKEVPTPKLRTETPRGDGELILVVEDDAQIREIARRVLEGAGYQVLLASNGAEGLDAFHKKHHEIAAVFTDMSMPVMDGASLISAVRKVNSDVKIMGASGYVTRDEGNPAAGCDRFLAKPYTSSSLLKNLSEMLALRN